jgi:protein-L-isoaspartate(D-aspartate) O-methyltransferase
MSALSAEREAMVRRQLRAQGIRDERVLAAMLELPRHRFLPPEEWDLAYRPQAVGIGAGQTISQPYIVARMSELLELRGGECVLEIGTGSGYQAAVLAKLGARVVSVERIASLARSARRTLAELDLAGRVDLVIGDGSQPHFLRARFDAIIVTAAAPRIALSWRDLLANGGRLVCPIGDRDWQRLVRVRRQGSEFELEEGVPCRFVPLLGAEGFHGH